MKVIDMIAASLVFIGGINWGMVGLFNFNFVEYFLAGFPALVKTVYVLVGVAAVYDFALWEKIQRRWECKGFYGETGTQPT